MGPILQKETHGRRYGDTLSLFVPRSMMYPSEQGG